MNSDRAKEEPELTT